MYKCGRHNAHAGANHACPSLDAEGRKEGMVHVRGNSGKEGAKIVTHAPGLMLMIISGTAMQSKIPRNFAD